VQAILCTDRKISSALGSAETTLKSRTLGVESWRCLTSGTDSDILCAVRLLQDELIRANEIGPANILQIIRTALNKRKHEKVDELIQGKFGISYKEFLETGKNRFPHDIFRAAIFEVEQTGLDAEFIIVGYTHGYPILVKTDTRCGATIREHFAVAGEGAYLAQAALLSRAHSHLEAFGRTHYGVYEAKRFSQGAPSVGMSTSITVLHSDGRHEMLKSSGTKFLDQKYEEYGPKKLTDNFSVDDGLFAPLQIIESRKLAADHPP
jgi:predicted GNAT family N-acyltransferase